MNPKKPIYQHLSSNGDGTGTTNAVGDYSSSETTLYIAPAADETFIINRMIVEVEDVGSFDSGGYGTGSALSNGITLNYRDANGIVATLTPTPITRNADWAGNCHDLTIHNFGTGNEFMTARWTFEKSGHPLVLWGSNGHSLEIVLNDDFTGLVLQKFTVQGYCD